MNYYPRFPAHYLAKTLLLTMEQDGAYGRLMDWYYSEERAIPHEKRYVICRCQNAKERAAVDHVLDAYFERENDAWHHHRIDTEISKATPKIEAARANGRKGGRPRKGAASNPMGSTKKPTGLFTENPLGFQEETQNEPSAKAPQSPDKREELKAEALGQQAARKTATRFPDFWAVYPVKKGRAEAEAKWRIKGYDAIADRIIADVEQRKIADRQWLDGFAPHGSTYVNARGWEDEIEPCRGATGDVRNDFLRRAV